MKRVRILVIEDDPLNLELVRDVLEHRGHEVFEAGSVAEGRTQIRATQPDIVLADIDLPGGGGELLVRETRRDPALADLPIIAVTACSMEGDGERLLQVGFTGYKSKPINTRTFATEIEQFLRKVDTSAP